MDNGARHMTVPRGELIDHLTHDLCDLAHETQAAAIITPTSTGRTARLIARHRTKADIIAVTPDDAISRQLAVVWGVSSVTRPFAIKQGDDRLAAAVRASFECGAVKAGALVVLLAGHPIEGGEGFPTIRVVRVGEGGVSCEP